MERVIIPFWISSFLLPPKNKFNVLEIAFFDRLKSVLSERQHYVPLHEKIVFSAMIDVKKVNEYSPLTNSGPKSIY